MQKTPRTLRGLLVLFVVTAPAVLRGQTTAEGTPPPTQSQSGYPDVRQEAANPALFPNPDEAARNATRTRTPRSSRGIGGRTGTVGRINDQVLKDADADPLPIRIAYRRAKTLAMERNPGLARLANEADAAPTDVEKRRVLRVYYNQLFAAVGGIDSSPAMKSHLDALKKFTEQRYNPQRRVVAGEEDILSGRTSGRLERVR